MIKIKNQRNKEIKPFFKFQLHNFEQKGILSFLGSGEKLILFGGIRKTKEEKNENDHGNKITKFGEFGFHFVAPNLQENWGII